MDCLNLWTYYKQLIYLQRTLNLDILDCFLTFMGYKIDLKLEFYVNILYSIGLEFTINLLIKNKIFRMQQKSYTLKHEAYNPI